MKTSSRLNKVLLGMVLLFMAMLPFTLDAINPGCDDDVTENFEPGQSLSKKTKCPSSTACCKAGSQCSFLNTPTDGLAFHFVPVGRMLAWNMTTTGQEADAWTMPLVVVNNYKEGLQAYLNFVNSLLPEQYFAFLFLPASQPSFEQFNPGESISLSGFAVSFHEQKQSPEYNYLHPVNGNQSGLSAGWFS